MTPSTSVLVTIKNSDRNLVLQFVIIYDANVKMLQSFNTIYKTRFPYLGRITTLLLSLVFSVYTLFHSHNAAT